MIPCRCVGIDITPPDSPRQSAITGVPEPDGYQPLLPAGQTMAERVEALVEQFAGWRPPIEPALTPEQVETWLATLFPLPEVRHDATCAHAHRPLTAQSARDWPQQGSTCAHVCGPDPDHRCDAKAVTTLRHALPSGGVRHLPLCGPCNAAESAG